LFDEVIPSDNLVVLHEGRVLANGEVTRVLDDSGARDVNTAFMRLTGAKSGSLAP
jgi:ABC-2 type transport system ATP-binding protein